MKDDDGNVALAHRGKIGGGRKGVGPGLFQAHFDGKSIDVIDGDRQSRVFSVGDMKSPRLLQQIQFFVREVERIKPLADQAGVAGPISSGEALRSVTLGTSLREGSKYAISRMVEADCDHGIVVNTLRKSLVGRGYQVGKDQYRDLYVHNGHKVTSLFEVKPGTSTTSLYAAIGQLMFRSIGFSKVPTLFFVAPIELGPDTRKKLKKLGIEVLGYHWSNGVPVFPDFAHWKF